MGTRRQHNCTPAPFDAGRAVTILFFVYEFFAHVRKAFESPIAESARWSAFYIGLALLFGVGIGTVSGWTFGGEYFAAVTSRVATLASLLKTRGDSKKSARELVHGEHKRRKRGAGSPGSCLP